MCEQSPDWTAEQGKFTDVLRPITANVMYFHPISCNKTKSIMTPVVCFPALGTRCILPRAWYLVRIFPRLPPRAYFSALGTVACLPMLYFCMFYVVNQTRGKVFHQDFKTTQSWVEKTRRFKTTALLQIRESIAHLYRQNVHYEKA